MLSHLSTYQTLFQSVRPVKFFVYFFSPLDYLQLSETKLQYNIFGLFLIWNAQLTYFVSVKQAKHNAPVLLTITSPVYLRTLSFF